MNRFDYLSPAIGDVVEGLEDHERIYALEQMSTYNPLRTLAGEGGNSAISRWELTEAQRQMIAEGADVLLEVLHFKGPLAPVKMMLLNQSDLATASEEDRNALRGWFLAAINHPLGDIEKWRGGGPAYRWHKFDADNSDTWPGREDHYNVVYDSLLPLLKLQQAVVYWTSTQATENIKRRSCWHSEIAHRITHWRELEWPKT